MGKAEGRCEEWCPSGRSGVTRRGGLSFLSDRSSVRRKGSFGGNVISLTALKQEMKRKHKRGNVKFGRLLR